MHAETGILGRVDGSASVVDNTTKVICSVTGPIEPKPQQELPTQAALEVCVRPHVGVPSTRERYLEDKLRVVLTPMVARYLYPRQMIQVNLQILASGEPQEYAVRELTACINAAYLALIDAGVGLIKSFGAQCAAVVDGETVVSPVEKQLLKSQAACVVAADSDGNTLLLECVGDFSEQELLSVWDSLKICIAENSFKEVIESKIQKDFIFRQ